MGPLQIWQDAQPSGRHRQHRGLPAQSYSCTRIGKSLGYVSHRTISDDDILFALFMMLDIVAAAARSLSKNTHHVF